MRFPTNISNYFLHLILCWTTVQILPAQPSSFNQYYLKQWDTDDGLPVDLILSLHQSQEGFIWLRTYNGLIRFDGSSFKILDSRNVPFLTSDNINATVESPDGTIWVTSPFDGLWSYRNGKIEHALGDCNPGLRLYWLSKSKELLFSSSTPKIPLIRYNPKTRQRTNIPVELEDSTFTSLKISGDIQSFNTMDKSGYEWWISGNQVFRARDGELEVLEVQSEHNNLFFFDLLVDGQDRVWIASTRGIFTWNGEVIKAYPGMESFQSLPISSFRGQQWILEDAQGGIWFILFPNIAYLPPGSSEFEFPPDGHPLSTMLVTSLLSDHEGNIWFSSQSGLARLSPNQFDTYSREEGLSNQQVETVAPASPQKYLISTINGGLAWNDQGTIIPFQFAKTEWNDINTNFYQMFTDSKGNIWGCSRAGIFKINGDQQEWYGRYISVRYGIEDKHGKIWFASSGRGIGFINDRKELEFLQFDSIDFQSHAISSIRPLRSGGWAVTAFNQGLKLIDAEGNLVTLEDDKGLSKSGIFVSHEEPDGTLWFPSQSGLFRLKDGRIDLLNHECGIPALSVFNFLLDKNGYVWLPSNFGIIRVAKQELDDFLDGKVQHINWRLFDEGDGMRSRSCTGARHSAFLDDGTILVPTLDGVVEINPDRILTNNISPPVVIHQFLWNDQAMNLTESIVLDPGDHRFVFSYSGLSLKAPEKVKFRFRLEGYDQDWIEATGDRRAIYTSLPYGNYRFQVIAANNDGLWNETGDSIAFSIRRPWWHRWWAYGMYGLFLILGLMGIDRIQKRRILKNQERLAKEKELEHAREIQKAYAELEQTHQNLKTTQDQLIHSEKMASLGELTAGIAHEIQNPLNFVNNFSEVNSELIDELFNEIKNRDWQEVQVIAKDIKANEHKIAHHGKRADGIVKNMLQHSRTSSSESQLTSINALADEYLRLAYHGMRARDKSFNAQMETDFDESIEEINVVPQEIGRVLLNIITNAFHAVVQRQSKSENGYQPQVKITTRGYENGLEIRIADNGLGIPDDLKNKIFQPFFTTKPTGEGTGLGLSLSYDIIKAHDGEIMVHSEEGTGTEFVINLPMSK